jgi:DNA-binding MurR/RpiR family transcriptional regulator
MKGHGEKLSRKAQQAIAALLTASTLAEAARTAGISEPTLWRWLQRAEFQAAYREARRAAVGQAVAHLQRASGEAVETLRAVMRDLDTPASARVSAARTVLDLALRAVELEDLAARVDALEQALQRGWAS